MKHSPEKRSTALPRLRLACLWLPLLLALQPALAQEESRLPITIEADRAEINEPQQVGIYTGNVVLIRGGLTIWSEVMRIHLQKNELQRVEAEGTPARYEQLREDAPPIRGHSLQLNYDAGTERILLLQQAELWQGDNRFSGERIEYDLNTKQVLASGAPEGAPSSNGRVQVIIQPKQATEAGSAQ